jgi:isopentenyldiphosphate isomerase
MVAMTQPAQELVDVIDESGRVVAVVTRSEMRSRRLPHRCVYILVFDSSGRLFLHQRSPTKDIYPSYWDVCVGGVLSSGESFDDGAGRESREELGVDLELEPLFPFRYADDRSVVQAHAYRAIHDGPFTLQREEIVSGRFVAGREFAELLAKVPFCPDGLEVWAAFQRHINR